MNLREKVEAVRNGKLDAVHEVKRYLDKINEEDKKGKKINAFLSLNNHAPEDIEEMINGKQGRGKAGLLAGLVFAVKSNINVIGANATCASLTLQDYKSPYDATVISKIKNEGGVVIGMTNMDEFAAGGTGENSAFGATKNPNVLERIPGGSSSGSAAAVAAGFCDVALGSDTGGSVRNPASHCGIIGFKPSYGAISRYGLIDLSMSFDQIGILGKSVDDVKLVYGVIKGEDKRDATSLS